MRKILSAGCAFYAWFFILPSSLKADTFKWVDDKGAVYYSDQSLNGKDADWVDDAPETYFSYKPSNELTSAKARVLPSRNLSLNTGQPQKIAPQGYGQAIGGGASAPGTSARKTSTFRQNSAKRSSAGRASTFRQNSAKRSSVGQTSTTRQNSVKRSSVGGGSTARQNSVKRSSVGRY